MSRFNSFLLTVLLFESIYIHVEGEFNNVQDLEQFVKEEFRHLRENEKELNLKISTLEKENEDKGTQLKKLEEELKHLKKERELDQRTRRQSRTLVAFTAYKSQHIHNITKEQKIVYENILLNDGNAYDSNTGVFTAPVSGVYLFSYSVGSKAIPGVPLTQYDVFTRLVINGVHQVSAVAESTSIDDDEQGSTTAILFVLEGDTVWTIHELKGGSNLYSADYERVTSFTGTLLYEKQFAGSIIG